jgi:hypothetical protein
MVNGEWSIVNNQPVLSGKNLFFNMASEKRLKNLSRRRRELRLQKKKDEMKLGFAISLYVAPSLDLFYCLRLFFFSLP